jgi:hypothetical protein
MRTHPYQSRMTKPKKPPEAVAAFLAENPPTEAVEAGVVVSGKRRRKPKPKVEGEAKKKGLPAHLTPGNPGNSGGKKGRSGRKPDWLKRLMTRLAHEKVLVERKQKDGTTVEEEVPALAFGIRHVLRSPGAKNYPAVLKTVLAYAEGLPVQRVEAALTHNFAVLAPAKPGSAEEWEKAFAPKGQLPPGIDE